MTSWAVPGALLWASLVGLAVFHGVNPGMGWLMAASRAAWRRQGGSALRAVGAISLGHLLSLLLILGLLLLARALLPQREVWLLGAGALLLVGIYRSARMQVPAGGAMQLGPLGLARWSFRMSLAQGTGLMLVPVLLSLLALSAPASNRALGPLWGGLAVLVHSAVLLLVMAAMALWSYRSFGFAPLRRWWVNLDFIWNLGLLGIGLTMLFT